MFTRFYRTRSERRAAPTLTESKRSAAFRALFAATTFALIASLGLTGCAQDTDGSGYLYGYWKSGYGDGFNVTVSSEGSILYTQYDNAALSVSFAGTVENSPELTAENGSLVIKITDSGSWYKTEGEYYVLRWNSLTKDSVKQSSAYSTATGADNDGLPSIAEAEAEYTIDNGYFGYWGEYIRQ